MDTPNPNFLLILLIASLLILSNGFFSDPILAANGQLQPVDGDNSTDQRIQTYIVHVQEKLNGTGGRLNDMDRRDWHRSFLPNSTLDSGETRMVYSYSHVISGFAARMSEDEAKAMESMDGFLRAYPSGEYPTRTTYTPKFLGLTGRGAGLWHRSNYGQGVVIGVIDTGIHPSHPSFQEDPLSPMPAPPTNWKGKCRFGPTNCNNKIIGSIGFRHGQYKVALDEDGHGTHVAGIAAGISVKNADVLGTAKGTASGMAPRAHLSIYKTSFKNPITGESSSDGADILRAFEEAIKDGVDVLNLSLGLTGIKMEDNPVIIGSYAAMEKGILPVAAPGNDGPYPSVIDNDAPWMLSVGAASVGRRIRSTVKLGNGVEFDGESSYQPSGYASKQLPLVFPGASGNIDDYACNRSFPAASLAGKIVMCANGGPTNLEKGENVKKAGAAAMIILNGWTHGNTTDATPHVLPASQVNNVAALELAAYAATTKPTAAIVFKGTWFGGQAPAVTSFSSRGPSLQNGGIIVPDIIAPGENILSAWPFEVGPGPPTGTHKTFNFASGTSMATPHVSGIAALVKGLHPAWSPAAIHSAIMTTSYIKDNTGVNITDEYKEPMGVFSTGSGHVDPEAAGDPGLVYDRDPNDYVNYLCGLGLSDAKVTALVKQTIRCRNVKAIGAEQVNYPSILVTLGPGSPKKTVTRTVTNVGGVSEVYRVDFTEPEGTSMVVTPSELRFHALDEKQSFTVTITVNPGRKEGATGGLSWDSGKHLVRSPIHFTYKP